MVTLVAIQFLTGHFPHDVRMGGRKAGIQALTHLLDGEARHHRQHFEPPVAGGPLTQIVGDFLDIVSVADGESRFRAEQVGPCGLRSFDLRGEQGLRADSAVQRGRVDWFPG